MIIDPLKDGKSRIELLGYLGGDLDIANDAKASFERVSAELGEKEVKLIHYLAKHNHTSPFRGTVFRFKVKAPIYICRQWFKHLIASNHNDEQLGWNERSFRYVEVEDPDEFYIPATFRQQSKNNKQATEGEISVVANAKVIQLCQEQCRSSFETYRSLIALGVGREMARGYLVPAVYTSWVWTVSLQSLLNFIDLRKDHGAQSEISAYSEAIETLISPIVPVAIEAWRAAHA